MSAVQYHYGKFPPATLEWERLIPLVGPANAALARYDGVLTAIPNATVLLSPLTTQEAVLSSRIEGTQATMGEVLEFEAEGDNKDLSPEKRDDIQEVLNYRKAMRHAESRLQELPLCQRIVKESHAILLDNARGHGKSPGQYRRIPNWIGTEGCTIEQARYVPISAGDLDEAMGAWDIYANTSAPDALVQLAILHAEFEALHPFLDGNGRLGRMFIPLFLHQVGLLQRPMFYISAYFERNRETYYERLLSVSRDNDWTGWCSFFLETVKKQSEENLVKTNAILELYNHLKIQIVELTRSQYSMHALDWIFDKPIFSSSDFVESAGIPAPTARRIISILREEALIKTLVPSRGRRSAVYAFHPLLNIAEGREMF
jgi:Fic family protein